MNRKILTEWYNGEQYELHAHIGCFGCMIEVDIKRVVRPDWKIFRTTLEDTRSFFIDEFETVESGCKHCFNKFIQTYEQDLRRTEKVKNFFKNA